MAKPVAFEALLAAIAASAFLAGRASSLRTTIKGPLRRGRDNLRLAGAAPPIRSLRLTALALRFVLHQGVPERPGIAFSGIAFSVGYPYFFRASPSNYLTTG